MSNKTNQTTTTRRHAKNSPRKPRVPSLRFHKASGQMYVVLSGRAIYCGRKDDPETETRYHQAVAEWLAAGRQPLIEPDVLTVKELIARFWCYAEGYYRTLTDGRVKELEQYCLALRPLKRLYAASPAVDFGPRSLKALREEMIRMGWSRPYVNKQINRIRHVFKWAVSDELIPSGVLHGLQAMSGLRKGRCDAYVLLNCMIPARPGGMPRRQNAENFLDGLRNIKGDSMPPVIVMFDPMPEADEEFKVSWSCDLVMRGVKGFVQKPFRPEGRTLDRVIKQVLADLIEPICCSVTSLGPPGKAEHPNTWHPPGVTKSRWESIPNEAIGIDDFMVRFCEQRSRENRLCRKRALLAAARHKTITLPPLAGPRKHGQPNRYFVHDLLAFWQDFLDEGINLPPLQPQLMGNFEEAGKTTVP